MAQTQDREAPRGAGAAGAGPATEQAPIVVDADAWYIVEKGVKTNPTFTITIKARQSIRIVARDVEAEVDCKGVELRFAGAELVVDPRYNTALLRRSGSLVAVSSKVRYGGRVYEARDFAELVKKSVKELIEEAAATVGL